MQKRYNHVHADDIRRVKYSLDSEICAFEKSRLLDRILFKNILFKTFNFSKDSIFPKFTAFFEIFDAMCRKIRRFLSINPSLFLKKIVAIFQKNHQSNFRKANPLNVSILFVAINDFSLKFPLKTEYFVTE